MTLGEKRGEYGKAEQKNLGVARGLDFGMENKRSLPAWDTTLCVTFVSTLLFSKTGFCSLAAMAFSEIGSFYESE
jgi:hypothetical protein